MGARVARLAHMEGFVPRRRGPGFGSDLRRFPARVPPPLSPLPCRVWAVPVIEGRNAQQKSSISMYLSQVISHITYFPHIVQP